MIEKMMTIGCSRRRDVVALHSAEFGDVQLLAGNELLLVAQIGLGPNVFKEFFARDAKPRMRLRQGLARALFENVDSDPDYAQFRGCERYGLSLRAKHAALYRRRPLHRRRLNDVRKPARTNKDRI